MVANPALAPSSKLAMEGWVASEALVDGLPEVEVHQLYRAMDFLLEAAEEVQFDVSSAVADLFNLEVDLIFLETTSTFFEIEGEDAGYRPRTSPSATSSWRPWSASCATSSTPSTSGPSTTAWRTASGPTCFSARPPSHPGG